MRPKGLTPIKLRQLQEVAGMHRDPEVPGLYLRVADKTLKGKQVRACSWVLRIVVNGKRRDLGLGGYPATTLASARALAREYRDMVKRGVDPLERVRKQRAEAARASQRAEMTFEVAAHERHKTRELELKSKDARDWLSRMERFIFPYIGKISVGEVTVDDVEKALKPIWTTKNTTANRVRGTVEDVFDWAVSRGFRTDNPAAWKGALKPRLPAPSAIYTTEPMPSLPYERIHEFMQDLKNRRGGSALALEFSILTATRAAAVTGADWSEFDLRRGLWTLPAKRAGVKHPKGSADVEITLSERAIKILESLPSRKGVVFARNGKAMRSDALTQVIQKMHEARSEGGWVDPKQNNRRVVQHGFRATFRTWAAECTAYPDHVAELCLGHKQPNAVVRAYKRTTLLEKRARLMQDWAEFIYSEPGERGQNVVPIRA